jgi:hypothetical protein
MRHKLSFSLPVFCSRAGTRAATAFLHAAAGVGLLLTLSACGPKFGDGCKNSTDCSIQNTRICDRSQPGGYCTIANCKPGDCGDDGVCVRFRPTEPRLSSSYCMGKCSKTSDCSRDAYVCRSATQLNSGSGEEDEGSIEPGEPFAEVLDGSGKAKFCIGKE